MFLGGVRIRRIYLAVGVGVALAVASALSMPQAAPANPASPRAQSASPADDPIGALLAQQALLGPQSAYPVVIGLKLSETEARTRFAVELSDPVDVRVYTLTNPNRVVIDMPEVLWRATDEARPSGRRAVQSYRYGLFRKGDFRFVIDLKSPVKVEMPQIVPPEGGSSFQLLVDLTPTTAADFSAHAGWPQDAKPSSTAVASLPQSAPRAAQSEAKRLIVVDPGHGGIDPGTHGQSGVKEKNLVLAVAKELRTALESTGRYRVQLTRDSDVFIPLRERVAIARAARADLFVSLHADSNDHREIRGASVYTLSEDASDREAAKLAEKENMSDIIAGVDLGGENSPVASILIDLAQRETLNRSARFAETVLTSLPTATMVRPSTPHRGAGFAVLKAPDVPAVLIELGYLTNVKDEAEMAKETWRVQVARAVGAAIDAHFSRESGPPERQVAAP